MASPGQKVVLITGCSTGIGLRIAVRLAKDEMQRYHVIATMRDLNSQHKLVEAAGDTYGKTLFVAELDICSDESVKQCVNGIKDRHVDVLINNAGIGLVGPVESIPMDEMNKVFETNFYGTVRMIKEVIPEMKKRRDGCIIVVSSVMGLQGVAFNEIYAASKFAIEGFCEGLSVQLLKFNIRLSMMEPGPVRTEFELKMIKGMKEKEWPGVDSNTVRYFRKNYLPTAVDIFEVLGQSPDDIAKCAKNVIEASSPHFHNLTNRLYSPILALKYADETGGLSVRAFYHMLFNLGPVTNVSIAVLKFLTFGWLRNRSIAPK
ncbi:retinol dehydrogenase 8-like [Archocentrus centrarchus]|uniref:retinol dehydrogenase 8-like n=1 Tax=Archocentrus centrarchus TaxID=63155 RepID=UPI0011EA4884|nr:retinol dehydrogenase 8-like [Archocentrus centrarchus]